MTRLLAIVLTSITILCGLSLAQTRPATPGGLRSGDQPPPAATTRPRQPRNPNRGPWDNDLQMSESAAGAQDFSPPKPFVERAGTATIARDKDGHLVAAFQWFPVDQPQSFDRIAVITSSDDGKTWDKPRTVTFEGLPDGSIRPSDPALVALDDGRLRLYFTSYAPGAHDSATFSAVSSDDVMFTVEPGARFAVDGHQVVDPTVAKLGKTWHYFAPIPRQQGKGYHATSEDGLTFKRIDDASVEGERRWLGCASTEGDHLSFYGTARNLWMATSSDGSTWALKEDLKIRGADPAVIITKDGRRLMILTGPPRLDAGTATPPADRPPDRPAPRTTRPATSRPAGAATQPRTPS